jgi:hypothetical protein
MHFFRIAPVSMRSTGGGNGGRSLYGVDESKVMYEIS